MEEDDDQSMTVSNLGGPRVLLELGAAAGGGLQAKATPAKRGKISRRAEPKGR